MLCTPDTAARAPDTDGEKVPLTPEPATEAEVLLALADPDTRPVEPAGLLRAVPCAEVAALASDREVAPDIDRPASARAALLCTPDTAARAPDTDGEKDPLAPEPDTAVEGLLALAEPDARLIDPAGRLRAVPCALADDRAIDCEEAPDMDGPVSARAPLLGTADTAERDPDTEGENDVLAPVALALLGAVALLAEAADWADAVRGLLRAAFIPEADSDMDCEAAEAIFWLVSSARAPRLATAESSALELDTDGVNEALAPEALTVLGEASLLAEADWAEASCGSDRAAFPPRADCAADCALAEVIFWLVSARASLLSTREVAVETEGASELLAPAALTALGALALAAEADCDGASCGVLRAALIPPVGWATDCADAARMVWLVSARASPLSTREAAPETEGENELLAPAAPTALGALALAAEADCAAASCGELRSAFAPDADCSAGCAVAAAMGVSRMDARISWLISCTADSSPFSASVSTCWLPPVRLVPMMTQFFS